MPTTRTEITEIATGLAMLGYQSLDRALEVRPRHITHVDDAVFEQLEDARAGHQFDADFELAWSNGLAFARSPLALRGRPPWTLEWKGHHRPASKSIETIPADLRIDHVYLVSCKYRSRILHNSGPATLFDHLLSPSGPVARVDWFEFVSPEAYRAVWQPVFARAGLPAHLTPSTVSNQERGLVDVAIATQEIDTGSAEYAAFVKDSSIRTAARWRARLGARSTRAELFWRLLRMQAAPYFVLGARHDGSPTRYRVSTPWDFSQRFRVESFDVRPGHRGQPSVDWAVTISDRDGGERTVAGHVEVRWSHGKLRGAPEAKVYLDDDPAVVPGYDVL